MFGFNKETKISDKISKSWDKVRTSFGEFLPTRMFETEPQSDEEKLFTLTNIYPVLRFMCVGLQSNIFKERIRTGSDLLDFFVELNEKVIVEELKSWREKNASVVAEAVLKNEGLLGKGTTVEELRRHQLAISFSKDPNVLIKRADVQPKFMPNYVRSAIEANFDEVLNLELSRTSDTGHNA